jgi:hypothetical protein
MAEERVRGLRPTFHSTFWRYGTFLSQPRGRCPDALVDVDLRAIRSRRAVTNEVIELFNPGYQGSAI